MRNAAASQNFTTLEAADNATPVCLNPIAKCKDSDESEEDFEKENYDHKSKMMLNLKRAISTLPQTKKQGMKKFELLKFKDAISRLETLHDVQATLTNTILTEDQRQERAYSVNATKFKGKQRRVEEAVIKYDKHPFLNGVSNPAHAMNTSLSRSVDFSMGSRNQMKRKRPTTSINPGMATRSAIIARLKK